MVGSDGFFVREPQQMKNLESVTVVAARASMSHSLLLTNMGKNFAKGLPEEACLQHAHPATAVDQFKRCRRERIFVSILGIANTMWRDVYYEYQAACG
jgi:hypothetical protein